MASGYTSTASNNAAPPAATLLLPPAATVATTAASQHAVGQCSALDKPGNLAAGANQNTGPCCPRTFHASGFVFSWTGTSGFGFPIRGWEFELEKQKCSQCALILVQYSAKHPPSSQCTP